MGTGAGLRRRRKREQQPRSLLPPQLNPKSPLLRRLGRQWSSKVPTARSPSKRLDNSMFINIPPTGKSYQEITIQGQTCRFREEKPSVLDMSAAVIARLQEKAGAPKDKILKVDGITPIQSNHTLSISQSQTFRKFSPSLRPS